MIRLSALILSLLFVSPGGDDARVESAVRQLLSNSFPSDCWRFNVDTRRVMSDAPLPDGELTASFAIAAAGLPSGHTMVELYSATRGSAGPVGRALVFVSISDSVLVAKRSIVRGEIIGDDLLVSEIRDVTNRRTQYLTPAFRRDVIGPEMVAKRDMASGRALLRTDVETQPTVHANDSVELILDRPGFRISLQCLVRENAAIGQDVRLICKDTGRMYRARIESSTTATWLETL